MAIDAQAVAATKLLDRLKTGDKQAFNELFNLVYDQLKQLAAIQRAQWDGDYTLNTTAILHEVYEKLIRAPNKEWESRQHFYRVAAKAMRQILYTYAVQKQAQKRGGHIEKISLEEDGVYDGTFSFSDERALEVIEMENAMKELEEISPREAAIVEYRFYLGLSVEETGKMLDISAPTVKRGWAMARAWLYDRLNNSL